MSRRSNNISGVTPDKWPFTNRSIQWGCFVADVLKTAGIRRAFIAPGSRSAPLALGFVRALGEHAVSVIDERTAGFLALGSAKATGVPAAVVCTSGTAASHFYPALIEARLSEVPMLILSADRPPEMRDCFSGQTIDQVKLFGNYPLWQHEFGLPEPTEAAFRYLRQMLVYGFSRACSAGRGPVHLNFPFRDPLHPIGMAGDCISEGSYRKLIEKTTVDPAVVHTLNPQELDACFESITSAGRGVIVVGPSQPQEPDAFADEVDRLACSLGWPILADGLSPLRSRAKSMKSLVVTGYDALLRNEGFRSGVTPDAVINIGPLPTSKILRQWLAAPEIRTWVVGDTDANWDGLHRNTVHLRCSVVTLAAAISKIGNQESSGSWMNLWSDGESIVADARAKTLNGTSAVSEPVLAWLLARHLPKGTSLLIGNSMPIRDLEMFASPGDNALRIHCNRGANGIDGGIAAAFGVAIESRSAVAVIGDVAFLHDIGSLINRPQTDVDLTVVVINNCGGGIFRYLPIGNLDDAYNAYFLTPHAHSIAAICNGAGVHYQAVSDQNSLINCLTTAPRGLSVIEVPCSTDTSIALRDTYHKTVESSLLH